jgi:hypothetical protein
MAKLVPDAIIDAQLDEIFSGATNIHVLSGEPANYAGISALELATGTISGSISQANGDSSGRKATVPAQTGLTIDSSGTANHVALSNGSDTLYLVTTCTSQALTSGGTVDTNAFDHEIGDAV